MPQALLNKPAPDFCLPDENNVMHTLSQYKDNNLVLYFYPKDETPGCTTQACSFRDNYQDYVSNNIKVIGVNYDSPTTHKEFKHKYQLPFTLLSDSTKEVAKKYGTYSPVLNRFFPKRITFLINKNGIIFKILDKVDVKNDAQEIIKYFKEK
jgi:thioredoxin-dependent peroxiredoxin